MDFDQAFAACIRDGNTAGITALGIDKDTSNEVLLSETPLPDSRLAIPIPPVRRPTPLIYAIYCGQPSIFEQLHNLGADLTFPLYNWHPIHYAAAAGEVAILDFILTHAASEIDVVTDHGATALHIAVSSRNPEVITLLLKRGADVGIANANGETALHIAMVHRETEPAEILLSFGAKLDAKNGRKLTPRELAVERGNTLLVEWLEKVQADPTLVRSKQQILVAHGGKPKKPEVKETDMAAQIDVLNQRLAALEELVAARDTA
jgi:ankyrin repeat protein